jgi:hypothetical protein
MRELLKRLCAVVVSLLLVVGASVAQAADTVVTPSTVTYPESPVKMGDLLGTYLTKFGTTVALLMGAALIVGLVYKGWRWVKRM